MHDEHDGPSQGSNSSSRPPRRNRGKLKRLVFGSLIAGGAIGLAGINAQAHGNASSHNAASLNSSCINSSSCASVAIAFSNYEVWRNDWFSNHPENSQTLQDFARQRLMANDIPGAVAAIESAGSPDLVMWAYLQAQFDLQKEGSVGEYSSAAFTQQIHAISDAGRAYYFSQPPGGIGWQRTYAQLLHNFASYMQPDMGGAAPPDIMAGQMAAQEELGLRMQIGITSDIGRVEHMLGIYAYRAQDWANAQGMFQAALNHMAGDVSSADDSDWSRAYLGLSMIGAGNPGGGQLVSNSRQSFGLRGNSYAIRYLDWIGAP